MKQHKMVISSPSRETTIPITEEQYQEIKAYLASDKCLMDCMLFADESEMIEEIDNAIKSKL